VPVQDEGRLQQQALLDRQQREGYTYEWLHTQVQHVTESPTSSNRRSGTHGSSIGVSTDDTSLCLFAVLFVSKRAVSVYITIQCPSIHWSVCPSICLSPVDQQQQ